MIPYLCGGTFLTQILRVTERTTTSTDHMNGQKESLPEREIFRRLLSIYRLGEFPADAGGSIKTYASQFKACQNSLASFTGFADNDSRMKFDRDVRSERSKALYMMSNFVSECIDIPKNGEQLVRCLLGMIKDDDTIKSTDEFYILPDGNPISKKDIDSTDKIYIEPFLLGVWHYVIMNRAEKNELGAETYKSWYPKRNDYRGTVGSDITMAIQVDSAKVEDPIKAKENVLRETFRRSSSDGFHNTTSFKKMFSSLFTNVPQKRSSTKRNAPQRQISEELSFSPFYTSSLLTPSLIELLKKNGNLIDLDKSPNMFGIDQENKECPPYYYKKTTEFSFQSIYSTNAERQIQVSASINKINIIGKTSKNNWKSISFIQNIIHAKSCRCTSVFKVIAFEDICIVQFLMIGEALP